MKLLVTGATGFLGQEVVRRLEREHAVVPVGGRTAPLGGRAVDLRQPGAWGPLLEEVQPDVVVHLAAYREPDFCEDHPEETWRLNTECVRELVRTLPPDRRLIFISTDYVFDGEHPPYHEEDERRPVNLYGRSKAEAEDAVRSRAGSLIVRIPLLVGAGPTLDRSGFLWQIVHTLTTPRPSPVDAVLIRFPTWIRDVAEVIAFLLDHHAEGIVHYSGPDGLTRYQMTLIAAEILGRALDHIVPSTEVVPRRAARPKNSQLATERIRQLGFWQFTPFAQVVEAFIRQFPEVRAL